MRVFHFLRREAGPTAQPPAATRLPVVSQPAPTPTPLRPGQGRACRPRGRSRTLDRWKRLAPFGGAKKNQGALPLRFFWAASPARGSCLLLPSRHQGARDRPHDALDGPDERAWGYRTGARAGSRGRRPPCKVVAIIENRLNQHVLIVNQISKLPRPCAVMPSSSPNQPYRKGRRPYNRPLSSCGTTKSPHFQSCWIPLLFQRCAAAKSEALVNNMMGWSGRHARNRSNCLL